MKHLVILIISLYAALDVAYGQPKTDAHPVVYNGQSQYLPFSPDGIPFIIAEHPWDVDSLGNHRAIIEVTTIGNLDAIYVKLPWRRPDLNPETKKIVVRKKGSEKSIDDVLVLTNTNEIGELVFRPEDGVGEYEVYYLPYKYRKGWGDARYGEPWNDYLRPDYSVGEVWETTVKQHLKMLPVGQVLRFESRSQFDAFTSMGLIATEKEQDSIYTGNRDKAILFPEDRAFPIRMKKQLPAKWSRTAHHHSFEGHAMKNEYYTWQVGVWAPTDSLFIEKIEISDLVGDKNVIPKEQSTCFNAEGIGWNGDTLRFDIGIPATHLQALWFGTQVPENCPAGTYSGQIAIHFEQLDKPKIVDIAITVGDQTLADRGDGELWRHARLRWLNSTIGQNDAVVHPYEGLSIQGNVLYTGSKKVYLSDNGLPQRLEVNNRDILASPISFIIEEDNGRTTTFNASNFTVTKSNKGAITWTSTGNQSGIDFICNGTMEFDGHMQYDLAIRSERAIKVSNVRLETSYTAGVSNYFMGIGHSGGTRPDSLLWQWNGPYDSYWLGDYNAGAHVEYLGAQYNGPLLRDYKALPPPSWNNNGKGRVTLRTEPSGTVVVSSETGAFLLDDSTRHFQFAILPTPVKSLDTKLQFSQRYYHSSTEGFKTAAKEGANIGNIHHSMSLNPVINYPFIVRDPLIAYINEMHEDSLRVKLYYTIRELSNYVVEIYALNSLNGEIFENGRGYGTPWHMEHLVDGYRPAWYTELPGQNADAALVLSGFSRWINYYLEGLRWMFENYKIDGIYMDDVSFDRRVMKRIRRIIDEYRPGALIDLHSNTGYSIGAANQYTDFFPYVDRLWFGESFKYNEMDPAEWFVTFSGIPFGVMSEMLQDGGNRFLGAVYGTTARHSYGNFSPTPIWNLWKSFGIENAEMLGYWDPDCPVKLSNDAVKATVFEANGSMLISIGNFSDEEQEVSLEIDWGKIKGIKPTNRAEQPFIQDFQDQGDVDLTGKIDIPGKEGVILIVK